MPAFIKAPKVRGVTTPHIKPVEDSPIQRLTPPASVTIPLTQHIGAPAKPVVGVGDQVYVGTVIAEAGGFISACTHSSVSGTVTGTTKILFPDSNYREAFIIESDGLFTADPHIAPPTVTNRKELVDAVAKSGLVGLGGAGFPTHVKLSPPEDKPAPDTLVINGAECEPYITSDNREMIEHAADIVDGLLTVQRLLNIPNAVVAIEKNKPAAIAAMKQALAGTGVALKTLKTNYPQGAEKVLIATVTGRAMPAGGLPIDCGCVILNVSTVSFLSKYLKTGLPLTDRVVTIAGKGVKQPGNYSIPIGTMISHVIASCGGDIEEIDKLIMGGPMMGISMYSPDFPILKYNNAILPLKKEETYIPVNDPCIRCGRCVFHCPMRLSPVEISDAYDREDIEEMKRLRVDDCIECGCCSYSCPASRHVTQTMRMAKAVLRKAGNNQ